MFNLNQGIMKKQTTGKDPAVLLYTQDFIVGTFTWTDEQRGKYILLLCIQHQKQNKLTQRDLELAGGDELVLEKFPLHSDGYYYNDRMAMEINNRKVRTDSSRRNGKLGGRPKVTKQKPMGFSKDNLNETYDLTKIKPTTIPHEDENENEDVVVNENATEDGNVTVSETKILKRYLDDLIQYEDVLRFKRTWEEVEDYGGLDKIFESLQFSESQRVNWARQINNVKQFI